jgi:hypothetical protein
MGLAVSNDSARYVRVSFDGDFSSGALHQSHSLILDPGIRLDVAFNAIYSVREWLENYDAAKSGTQLPHRAEGSVTMSDRNENGVDDTWHVKLTGSPIERVQANAGIARQLSVFRPS